MGEQRDGDFARSASELRKFARLNRDKNVYVAPNPTGSMRGVRHSAADVTHWSYFLIDMDPICLDPAKHGKSCDKCWRKADPRAALALALHWFGEWTGRNFSTSDAPNFRPPIVIDSGRGCQAWIRLEDVGLFSDGEIPPKENGGEVIMRSVARRVNGYWLKRLDEQLRLMCGCRIDTSVSDLPRVMRCPGTINVKTRREAKFIVATDDVFRGLARKMVEDTPRREMIEPPREQVAPGLSWQRAAFRLTRMAQEYLTLGREEPGRHKVMWHTAKKFQEVGVSRSEARKAIRWANALRGPNMELSSEEIEHALDTAYGT